MTDLALLLLSSSRNARVRTDEELVVSMSSGLSGLHLRSHLAAGWMSGFSWGAIKPPTNARPPSSPKSMPSSLNCGAPPTCLASVLLPQLSSHQLTVLKRKDASACPLWMSPWPRISAHPWLFALAGCGYSAAGQVASTLHSMAKMLASEEAGLDAASLRDPRSVTDRALHATAQAIGRRCPAC